MATATKIPEEVRRLAAIDVAKIRQSLKDADQSKLALAENNFVAALGSAKEALSLWPENESATRLQEEIKTRQAKAIAAAAEAAEEKKRIAAEEQKRLDAEAEESAAQAAREAAAAARSAAAAAPKASIAHSPEEKPFLLTATGASFVVALIGLLGVGIGAFRKLKGRSPESID
jgi:hypothetical protein